MKKPSFRSGLLALALVGALSSSALASVSSMVGTPFYDLHATSIVAQSGIKTQTGPALFYSNNPERLSVSSTGPIWSDGVASDLAYVQNLSQGTYRIFAGHSNVDSTYDMAFGVVVKGSGSVQITKKGVAVDSGTNYNYAQTGMDSATKFLDSAASSAVTWGGQWTLLDGTYTLTKGHAVAVMYEVKLTGTGTWSMAVTASKAGTDLQGQWRTTTIHDAAAPCDPGELPGQRGLFQGVKTVGTAASPVVYDFTGKAVGYTFRDQIGHQQYNQSDPTSDAGTDTAGLAADGWVTTAPGGYGACSVNGRTFLAGNYGVEYQYTVQFKGGVALAGHEVNVFFGPGVNSDNSGFSYGVAAQTGSQVWGVGPRVCEPPAGSSSGTLCQWGGYNPATVKLDPAGNATFTMKAIPVANVNLPYHVWYRLY